MGPYICNLLLNILPVQMWTSSTLGGQIRRWSFWTMGRRLRWEGHMTSCISKPWLKSTIWPVVRLQREISH